MDGRTVSVNPHSRAYTLDYLHSPSCLLYSETVGRRYRIGSAITLACLPSILLILEGCSSTPPPSGVHFPITNGSHTLLPSTQQRILIWGDPLLARVADEWLRSHHYSNILMPPQIPYPPSDRQVALVAAAEVNAAFVLILEREELSVLRGGAHYPHCVEPNEQTVRHLTCQALATA